MFGRKRLLFENRFDAGKRLAKHLSAFITDTDALVFALPRGGVPVGYEVAKTLHWKLDIFLVRKIGMPGQEELALGAVASGGVEFFNDDVIRHSRLSPDQIESLAAQARAELEDRESLYRGIKPATRIEDRTTILVDDGLATGASMKAACRALRRRSPKELIVAVPVGARETCAELEKEADQVICLETPDSFLAVGRCYKDFSQTTDDEVRRLLKEVEAGDEDSCRKRT